MTTNKGSKMEESLRTYFLKAGYYVVRGVPFIYEGFDVTDIDLWIYGRTSAVSREITIVDIKNKKTPQAIERIFWIQGLKQATNANSAVVATTDIRPEVKKFGIQLGISVLDGAFLKKVMLSDDSCQLRLSDEDFFDCIDNYSLGKLDGDWRGRIYFSKGLLAKGLSFDQCNEWLAQGLFFAEQVVLKPQQQETALRCLYLICSFIAISLDNILKEATLIEPGERKLLIEEGIRFGSKGKSGLNRTLDVAIGLIEQYSKNASALSREIRSSVLNQMDLINSCILGDYFSRHEVGKSLFKCAKEFENCSYSKVSTSHQQLSLEAKSILFCLIDFWGIDRSMFTSAIDSKSIQP